MHVHAKLDVGASDDPLAAFGRASRGPRSYDRLSLPPAQPYAHLDRGRSCVRSGISLTGHVGVSASATSPRSPLIPPRALLSTEARAFGEPRFDHTYPGCPDSRPKWPRGAGRQSDRPHRLHRGDIRMWTFSDHAYDPGGQSGPRLLALELAHGVQRSGPDRSNERGTFLEVAAFSPASWLQAARCRILCWAGGYASANKAHPGTALTQRVSVPMLRAWS